MLNRLQIYIAIALAAIAKFLFLTFAVKLIFPLILGYAIPEKLAVMMTTLQLVTALVGGLIYF